jgi:hypothetical protein
LAGRRAWQDGRSVREFSKYQPNDAETERLLREAAEVAAREAKSRELAESEARRAADRATQEAEARELTESNARRAADRAATVLRGWLAVVVFAGVVAIGASVFAVVTKKTARDHGQSGQPQSKCGAPAHSRSRFFDRTKANRCAFIGNVVTIPTARTDIISIALNKAGTKVAVGSLSGPCMPNTSPQFRLGS